MVSHNLNQTVSISWTTSSLGAAVSRRFSMTVNEPFLKETAGFRLRPSAGHGIALQLNAVSVLSYLPLWLPSI